MAEPFHQPFINHHCCMEWPRVGPRRDGRPEPRRSRRRTPPGMAGFSRPRGRVGAFSGRSSMAAISPTVSVTGSGIRKSGNLAWSSGGVLVHPKGGKWVLVTWACAVGYGVGPLLGSLHVGVQGASLNHGRACPIGSTHQNTILVLNTE